MRTRTLHHSLTCPSSAQEVIVSFPPAWLGSSLYSDDSLRFAGHEPDRPELKNCRFEMTRTRPQPNAAVGTTRTVRERQKKKQILHVKRQTEPYPDLHTTTAIQTHCCTISPDFPATVVSPGVSYDQTLQLVTRKQALHLTCEDWMLHDVPIPLPRWSPWLPHHITE